MNPRLLRTVLVALVGLVSWSNVFAQHPFTLSVAQGTASISSATQSSGYWTIAIGTSGTTEVHCTLTTTQASTLVELVEVDCDVDVVLSIDESGSGTFADLRSILEPSSGSLGLLNIDTIDISGDLGSVENYIGVQVATIRQLFVGGDLGSHIITGIGEPDPFELEVAEIGGDLGASRFHIDRGSIGELLVGGAILRGASSTGSRVRAYHGIRVIEADEIDTDLILANNYGFSEGNISRIVTRSGDLAAFVYATNYVSDSAVAEPGVFVAGDIRPPSTNGDAQILAQGDISIPIEAESLLMPIVADNLLVGSGGRGDITVTGPCEADISIEGVIETLINLKEGLAEGATIIAEALTGAGGIGQIIMGSVEDFDFWEGDVEIDGVTLSPVPEYAQTGLVGAVGEVPFHLHDGDCLPANGGAITPGASSVTLYFYGPVT